MSQLQRVFWTYYPSVLDREHLPTTRERNRSLPGTFPAIVCRPMADLFTLLQGAATVGERIKTATGRQGDVARRASPGIRCRKGIPLGIVNETSDTPRKPSAETLFAIGTVLGVSVGDLLGKTLPSSDEVPTVAARAGGLRPRAASHPRTRWMLAGIRARGRSPNPQRIGSMSIGRSKMYSEGRLDREDGLARPCCP